MSSQGPAGGPGGTDADTAPERWTQVAELLNDCVDLTPGERVRYLDRACAGDPEIRRQVEELLGAHHEEGALDRLGRDLMDPLLRAVRERSGSVPELRRYQVGEELGRGGMGVVYRARDLLLERDVALKFLPPRFVERGKDRERFLREARAAAQLDHPNICTVHEIGETPEGGLFISMPRYEGETLKRRLSRGPVPWEDAVPMAEQVAAGLARAHEAGVVHRDIKPANLFLTREGVLKILDFGVAKVSDATGAGDEGVLGTAAYMSPEQARGEAVDGRSDLWSLGVVLFEMLTGERLFPAEDADAVLAAIRSSEPLPLGRLRGVAPSPVLRAVEELLARDPARRTATGEVAARRLREAQSQPADARDGKVDEAPALAPEGERRQATVLAVRVSGYDVLLERSPAAELEGRMARLRSAVDDVVRRHGGHLTEFVRDRLAAVFGIPVTHEDDVLRAVRAARELHALGALGPEEWGEEPVSFQVGIATGTLVARPGTGADYHLAGALPEMAARLAAAASPGEIRMDPVSHQPFLDPSNLTAYTGRDLELETLLSAFRRASEGQAQFISVMGEAGMGKSRLLLELRMRAAGGETRILHGQCQSYAGRGPYHPFVGIVLQLLELDGEPGPGAEDRIVAALRSVDAELERYLPFYLHLLSVPSRRFPPPPGLLRGEQFRASMREALIGLLAVAGEERPTLLLLEDWHWADEASRELLAQMSGAVGGCPLLVVVAARPGYGTEWDVTEPWTLVQLKPLPLDASARMLRALVGGAEVLEEVAATLHERAGGNPFFLEELCQSLKEAGVLRIDEGRAILSGPLGGLHLPTTIQGVIRTRLDRLPVEAREVAREAAVLGPDFSRSLLERMGATRPALGRSLDHLVSVGILQQTRAVPERRFRFKHALTREVAYDTLLHHQRAALHDRAGKAMVALYPDRLREEAPRLAHHFSRAERWAEAVKHGLVAARRARDLAEFADALDTLEQVDSWISRLPPGPRRRELEVETVLRQEGLCETLGLRGRQQELLDRVGELAEGEGDKHRLAEVHRRKGDVYTLLQRFEEAEAALAAALELAREVGDPRLEGSVLRSQGLTGWHQGRTEEALRNIDQALVLDRERGDAQAVIADLNNKAKILKDREEYLPALQCLEEALELLEETPSDVKTTYILHNMATVHRATGDPDRALELLERVERICRESHLPVQGAFHLTSIAHIHLTQGRIEDAVESYRDAVSMARRARYAEGLAHSLKPLGELLARIGREAEAISYLQEAARIFGQLGNPATEALVWREVAEAAEGLGDRGRARDAWARCEALGRERGDDVARMAALEGLARALRELDPDPEQARGALEEALALARARGDRSREAGILNSLGILNWRCEAWEDALDAYRQALELFRELGEETHAGLILNSLALILARAGRTEEARTRLQEALESHRRTGASLLEGHALATLGDLALQGGDREAARESFVRSLEIRRSVGDRLGEGWMHQRLADVNLSSGRRDAARSYLDAARRIAEEVEDTDLRGACEALPI